MVGRVIVAMVFECKKSRMEKVGEDGKVLFGCFVGLLLMMSRRVRRMSLVLYLVASSIDDSSRCISLCCKERQ